MEMEAYLEYSRAYEEYLDAKKAYEEWRDGYMPYFEDKKYYESELERLMYNMDAAEDWYNLTRLEYESIIDDIYHHETYEEVEKQKFPFKSSLKELYDEAEKAKKYYDDLAYDRVPFLGSPEELKSELERRRDMMRLAIENYNDVLTSTMLKKIEKNK